MSDAAAVLGDWRAFLSRLFALLAAAKVDVAPYELDHVCYRADTLATYAAKKRELEALGRLLTEADVNGRPIATYFLREPLRYEGREIRLVELPAPKPSKPSAAGLEHAEFAVGAENMAKFLAFDTTGLAKAANPEIELSFGPIAAKFHPTSLLDVIQTERGGGAATVEAKLRAYVGAWADGEITGDVASFFGLSTLAAFAAVPDRELRALAVRRLKL